MRLVLVTIVLLSLSMSCQLAKKNSKPRSSKVSSKENAETLSLYSPKREKAKKLFEKAELYLAQGKVRMAQNFFLKSYKVDKSPHTAVKIITIEIATGRLEQAFEKLEIYLEDFPSSVGLRIIEAAYYFRKGDKEKGLEILKNLKSDFPESEMSYYELVTYYLREKQVDQALVVIKELVKNKPEVSFGWALMASLYHRQGKTEEAISAIEKANSLNPKVQEYIFIYGHLLMVNGDFSKAYKVLSAISIEELIKRDSFESIVKAFRSFIGVEESLTQLESMKLEDTIDIPAYAIIRVYLSWELGREKSVSKWLSRFKRESDKDNYIDYLQGINLQRQGLAGEATGFFLKVSKDSDYFYPARKLIFDHYIDQKEFTKAVSVIDEVLEDPKAPPEFYFLGASVYSEQEKYKQAMPYIEKGYKIYPDQVRFLFLKGVYQEKLGQIEKAIASMRGVIAKDQTFSSAYNYLGYLYAERGENLDEAEELIKKALELKPNDGYYLDSLGWVYYQKKDYEKALKFLRQAVKVVQIESIVFEHLGDTYSKLSMIEDARKSYQEAMRINIDDTDRKRIQEKIKKLRNRI